MIPKLTKIAVIVAIIAFSLHGILSPFFQTGYFRFIAPIAFIGIILVFLFFLRRQRWTWLLVFVYTLFTPITSILFPPTEKNYGDLTLVIQIIYIVEALACGVIFFSMLLPATKKWFMGPEITENVIKESFHKGEVFEVVYRNNFLDIAWFNIYQFPRSRTIQISFILIILGVAQVIFGSLSDSEFSFGTKILTFLIILVILFLGLLAFTFAVLVFTYTIRKFDIRSIQNCKLSVSEGGALSETPFRNNGIKWSGIKKIQRVSNYILFYFSDMAAIMIPRRIFASEIEADKFFNYSQQCFEKSNNTNSPK